MRLKVIGCKVLTREMGYLSAQCPHFLDFTWLRQGYHNEPDLLRNILQEQIDRIDADADCCTCSNGIGEFDAILLGYGLCSNGSCGVSSKKYPIVIPRAHDCITLFLGSKERYRALFDSADGGIYWYTPGWIENSVMPSRERDEMAYQAYLQEYDEDNAQYLMEMEQGWMKKYRYAYYIQMPGISYPDYRGYTRSCADYLGWEFRDEAGDDSLLRRFLWGEWDPKEFLVLPPNTAAQPSYTEDILCPVPQGEQFPGK